MKFRIKNKKLENFLKEIYPYAVIVLVVLLIKTYLIAPIQVNGDSMLSTLHNGDIMLLQKIGYHGDDIKRFDIVVIDYGKSPLIKRVIGLPGDTIKVEDNKLYINNKEYKEDYLDEDTETHDFSLEELFSIEKIPSGYYFVLGDNRMDSLDSRIIGLVSSNMIEGKAIITLFPFNRFGAKE